jgi:hypothetical protein
MLERIESICIDGQLHITHPTAGTVDLTQEFRETSSSAWATDMDCKPIWS